MSSESNTPRDLFLRVTDTGGGSVVRCHRVWDVDRFLAAQQGEASNLNAKAVEKDPRATQFAKIEMISEAEYLKARKQ